MKLIIDIPKKTFEDLRQGVFITVGETFAKRLIKYIKNGIPLPKGHGRIADMDETIKCIKEVEGDDAIWAISLIEWACDKRTIIEADKTERGK